VHAERAGYYARRAYAKSNPDKALSIIMDATSQAEWNLPHFSEATKASSKANKLGTHLVGAHVHGICSFLYGMFDDLPHDSNLTVEVLHRTLCNLERMGHQLPPRLDLQLDNCSRENKNR
jgi:hypothetical protein